MPKSQTFWPYSAKFPPPNMPYLKKEEVMAGNRELWKKYHTS